MTHYSAAVLLPPCVDPTDRKAVEGYVEAALEPYSEHLMTDEPYKRYIKEERKANYRKWARVLPSATDAELLVAMEEGGKGYHVDEGGLYEMVSWNPQGYWDYWSITNGWTEGTEITPVKDLPVSFTTLAVVTGDGTWAARGAVGWWGQVAENQPYSDWLVAYKAILDAHADWYLVSLDCHT